MDTTSHTDEFKDEFKSSKKSPISLRDIAWSLFIIAVSIYGWSESNSLMDGYEVAILVGTAISMIALGRFWQSIQPLTLWVTGMTLLALWTYHSNGNVITANEETFLLKYLISSQSAIMWMSALFVM